jgi:hypothetical protein
LPSILKGNNSIITGNTTFTVRPTFANNVPWDTGNQPVQMMGQCRLVYINPTTVTLIPSNGNQIFINGSYYTIPAAGVSLTSTGLTLYTLQYIYAFISGGNLTLTASTTGHGVSGTWGHEVMIGNPAYTLVGMVYPSNVASGPTSFYDNPNQRLVASYFNRRRRSFYGNATSATSSSTTWVELISDNRVYLLSWNDESINASIGGYMSSGSMGIAQWASIGYDSINPYGQIAQNPASTSNYAVPAALTAPQALGEGFHYITPLGKIGGGSGTWVLQVYGDVNQ